MGGRNGSDVRLPLRGASSTLTGGEWSIVSPADTEAFAASPLGAAPHLHASASQQGGWSVEARWSDRVAWLSALDGDAPGAVASLE